MKIRFKELNSGYEGVSRVSRFSKKTKTKLIITGVLVAVFVFVYILSSVGLVPLEALNARFSSFVFQDADNFPISINTDSVVNIKQYDDGVIVLSSDCISIYNAKGKEILSQPHTFSSPSIAVNGDKAVVFDRGDIGYTLISGDKIVSSGEADGSIICAEYGESGNFAFATRAKSATSMLTVYSVTNKVQFQWSCAYEHIVSIALSSNGKFAGVATLGADNGEIFTCVKYFGFDYSEPLNSQTLKGASALAIEFTQKNTLTLFSDIGVYAIEKDCEKPTTVAEYYSTEFNSYDVSSSGKYAVAIAKYGSANDFQITIYNPDGTSKKEITSQKPIESITMSDKYIFALAENELSVYNLNGNEISNIELVGDAYSIFATDKYIFINSLNRITRAYSYGDSSIDLTK